jgi:hypothetical protein
MGATMEFNAHVKPKALRVSFMKAFVIYDDARTVTESRQKRIQQIELTFLETNFVTPDDGITSLLLEKMRNEEENHGKGPRRSWA